MTTPVMNGFVADALTQSPTAGADIMQAFAPDHVPVMTALAQNFALLDAVFASVPAETYPNRITTLSGTSAGYVANDKLRTVEGWAQPPIMQRLDEAGVDWRVYFGDVPTAGLFKYCRTGAALSRMHTMTTFFKDVAAGTLPPFTYIDPAFIDASPLWNATDMHPTHNVANAEALVKSVYEALRAGPQWDDTVLIITADEHGGFYDHGERQQHHTCPGPRVSHSSLAFLQCRPP